MAYSNLNMRITEETKDCIKKFASDRGMNVTEYVLFACYTTESMAENIKNTANTMNDLMGMVQQMQSDIKAISEEVKK